MHSLQLVTSPVVTKGLGNCSEPPRPTRTCSGLEPSTLMLWSQGQTGMIGYRKVRTLQKLIKANWLQARLYMFKLQNQTESENEIQQPRNLVLSREDAQLGFLSFWFINLFLVTLQPVLSCQSKHEQKDLWSSWTQNVIKMNTGITKYLPLKAGECLTEVTTIRSNCILLQERWPLISRSYSSMTIWQIGHKDH